MPMPITASMMLATTDARKPKSVQYQYSDLDARPSNWTYLLKPELIASVKFIWIPPICNQRIRSQDAVIFQHTTPRDPVLIESDLLRRVFFTRTGAHFARKRSDARAGVLAFTLRRDDRQGPRGPALIKRSKYSAEVPVKSGKSRAASGGA